MKYTSILSIVVSLLTLLCGLNSCTSPKVPTENVVESETSIAIIPDYTDLTLPPNIAPMNFEIDMPGDEYIARVTGSEGKSIISEGKVITWDTDDWHSLLDSSKGENLQYEVYVRSGDRWTLYKFTNQVAREDIDKYISYRLIEPSFVHFSGLTLNQRDLTNFDEEVIWNNPMPCDERRGYCINCHVPRNQYRDHSSLFHIRGGNGGTIIMTGDSVVKVDLKTDETISAGVYPAWHPTLDLIAFSTNATAQKFPRSGSQKTEVYDTASDLILYDLKTHEISDIAASEDLLETYPGWDADGKKIYYSVAKYPEGINPDNLPHNTEKIRYDIVSRDFDPATRQFSEPDTVVCATKENMSVLLPRISPDGKHLLYCKAPYGSFHIWHKESDLYITDLASGVERPLSLANSNDADSYHSWSSNSRWIVFSSRRDDGSYTRPYIAYIAEDGSDSKAFVMPQLTPDYYREQMKSYNVPEFLAQPFDFSRSDILPLIRNDASKTAFKR